MSPFLGPSPSVTLGWQAGTQGPRRIPTRDPTPGCGTRRGPGCRMTQRSDRPLRAPRRPREIREGCPRVFLPAGSRPPGPDELRAEMPERHLRLGTGRRGKVECHPGTLRTNEGEPGSSVDNRISSRLSHPRSASTRLSTVDEHAPRRVLSPMAGAATWRHHLRQEPGAVVPHAGICAGGAGRPAFLPRPLPSPSPLPSRAQVAPY
jgi:hypothetical protein